MKCSVVAALGTALVLFTASAAVAQSAPAGISFHNISGLTWMAGAWIRTEGERTNEEHWMAPAGGVMLGMGRSLKSGKLTEFEFMRIETRADGVFFVGQPQGGSPTDFRMVELAANRVTFHNPDHDFPKRIAYWLGDNDVLNARIEGDAAETARAWSWQRVKVKP